MVLIRIDLGGRSGQCGRVELILKTPGLQPHGQGALVIDETGDRKAGHKTAHVGRQYLANLGKIENGVVSVTSLWADEKLYYPLDVGHTHQRLGLRVAKQTLAFVPS